MNPDFTKKLLEWNSFHNERQMPWKGERDPYRVWISEIILQQTRVEQGWAYYERFVSTYPDVFRLAAAADNEVFKLWEGLGYYSRCKNLLQAARHIVHELNGKFPTTYLDILKLKGVGPYTASAISSFVFGERQAVVDGNVQRVLARYFGIFTPIDSGAGKSQFASLAQSLIPSDDPGIYNQAIMDFGATVCKPRNPLCASCLLQTGCHAYNNHQVNLLPIKDKALKKRVRWMNYFIIRNEGCVYIRKRDKADIWENLHEFVLLETTGELDHRANEHLESLLHRQPFQLTHFSKAPIQQLSHQQIRGNFYVVDVEAPVEPTGGYMRVNTDKLHDYAFPRFINRFMEEYRL